MEEKRSLLEGDVEAAATRRHLSLSQSTIRWARAGKAMLVLAILAASSHMFDTMTSPRSAARVEAGTGHRIVPHPNDPSLGGPFSLVPCYPNGGGNSSHWKCGYLDVPLDYTNKSDSRTARLAVVMYQVGEKKSEKTVVINPGGPGGSGTYYSLRAGETISRNYTDHTMDILGFDPRGVNMSTPSWSCFQQDGYRDRWTALTSQFPETSKTPIEHLRLTDAYATATWSACENTFGDMGRFLSTAFVARDVDSIREALGEETLNAYMVSYGTNIGVIYSQMFPDRVGRMLLDGVDPADQARTVEGWGKSAIGDIEKAFIEGVLGECVRAGPKACALAKDEHITVDDLKNSTYALFDRLKTYPLPATHPKLGPGVITYETVDSIIYSALYNSASWPMLARMLSELQDGNGTLALQMQSWNFDPLLSKKKKRGGGDSPGWAGVHVPETSSEELTSAVVCSDSYDSPRHNLSWWNELQAEMVQQSPLGGSMNWEYVIGCRSFKTKVAEVYRGTFNHTLRNPILLIGETHDPATPLRGARHIHDILGRGNSRLVEHHGYGHSSRDRSEGCTERIKRELFLLGKVPERDVTECFADGKPYPLPSEDEGKKNVAGEEVEMGGVPSFGMEEWAELAYFSRKRMAAH
ncbi:unnamed protein product [Tilletia laevis]|uniref:AB hydrolase-1 domain-containing protein n=2 Tax=Tilletia TaxID=13289 RepID=A0A8X7MXH8_9BASI|nr:hypothetical protein CF336_g2068 [Tilletia laevis]KAE8202885.1 hypothetical protein CF328_g1963 [Tilletia controversa]KAE8263533.1 hypothetical protein A4X03_0g1613 [Tilletia caries]KAE8207095.1 hypothetical protein CF335_g1398 [Tilletia laevis]KAE8251902.1 hypothetical protein A4X06_0g2494 [Tilletia controversa]